MRQFVGAINWSHERIGGGIKIFLDFCKWLFDVGFFNEYVFHKFGPQTSDKF